VPPESRRAVLSAIRWANPDVILTHCPNDGSTDHAMTAKIVSEVILSLPGRLVPADEPPITKTPSVFFWDTSAGIGNHPEVYVDISDVMEQKLAALSVHKSQYAWMDTFQIHGFLEHVKILNEFRGLQIGVRYAEGYTAMRVHGFMPNMKLLP
jgi:LmbE family N-acetylglucosaminyl deacetylase